MATQLRRGVVVYTLDELFRAQTRFPGPYVMRTHVGLVQRTFREISHLVCKISDLHERILFKSEIVLFLPCMFMFIIRAQYRFRSVLKDSDLAEKLYES